MALLHEMQPELEMAAVLKETGDIVGHRMNGERLEELATAMYARAKAREGKAEGDAGGGADGSEEANKAERLRQWAIRLRTDLAAAGVKGEFVAQLVNEGKGPEVLAEQVEAKRAEGRAAGKAKKWEKMAGAYGDLARMEKKDWPLYLQGWALVKGGKKQEGEAAWRSGRRC